MNSDTIEYLAELARLDIPEEEKQSLIGDLESVIGFVDTIQTVEINSTSSSQTNQDSNIFREDVVNAVAPVYDLIEAAPEHQDHFVKVPKVLQ
jgi:aspartyl-tRNA(Asn)/glutamyl-tRNA(Gln) amidotransferase subunit C